jgi:hypothetical protein
MTHPAMLGVEDATEEAAPRRRCCPQGRGRGGRRRAPTGQHRHQRCLLGHPVRPLSSMRGWEAAAGEGDRAAPFLHVQDSTKE